MPAKSQKYLTAGLTRRTRAGDYHQKGLWAVKAKNGGFWPVAEKKTPEVVEKKLKNGEVVYKLKNRNPHAFPLRKPTHKKAPKQNKPTTRASLVPGRVAIILAGEKKGSRVVVLKTLASGLVLVTGPKRLNSVSLRRVAPAYLIATSVTVDLKSVEKLLEEKKKILSDDLFRRTRTEEKPAKKEKVARESFHKKEEEVEAIVTEESGKKLSPEEKKKRKAESRSAKRKADVQSFEERKKRRLDNYGEAGSKIDELITKEINKTPLLAKYMATRFSLLPGQHPHSMKF